MGLDSNLYREKWIGGEDKNKVTVNGKQMKDVSYIKTEVAYWRKAWHIHTYFQDRCADKDREQSDFYVDTDVIEELHKICNDICKHLEWGKPPNNGDRRKVTPKLHSDKLLVYKLMHELLPYNYTEFDEGYYLWHVVETKVRLDELTKEHGWNWDSYYYSSSW